VRHSTALAAMRRASAHRGPSSAGLDHAGTALESRPPGWEAFQRRGTLQEDPGACPSSIGLVDRLPVAAKLLCPIDGNVLTEGATGRPARFCSIGCRRAGQDAVRRLDREVERLERRRTDLLIEAKTAADWSGDETRASYSKARRAEAAVFEQHIELAVLRLRDLHRRLAGEDTA